jgi:hypothetical protein
MRVKSMEEEMNEEDIGEQKSERQDSQGNFSGRGSNLSQKKKKDEDYFMGDVHSAEEDGVNIGATKARKSQDGPNKTQAEGIGPQEVDAE